MHCHCITVSMHGIIEKCYEWSNILLLKITTFVGYIDPSEMELCHSMANMVAVVLACEPCSNHLWYHMFAANELSGSHMTGFMVSPIIILASNPG